MNVLKMPGVIIAALVLVLGYMSVYVVTEGHQALVLQLGKIVSVPQTNQPAIQLPGLHYKIPLINQVKKFDVRLRTWEGRLSRIVTAEKQEVAVNYYVKWKITDVARYFTGSEGDDKRAQMLLIQGLNNDLRAQFGAHSLSDIMMNEPVLLSNYLREHIQKNADALGVMIVDVELTRIELANIYAQMQVAQTQLASERRAEGKANAEAIRAAADANAAVITAVAKEKAAVLRGDGDAKAAKIYADAYSNDPSFYTFYRSMVAYKKIFSNRRDILVLSPEGQFFKYFNNGQGKPLAEKKTHG
jgi:membrane protease subunit HflC